MSIWLDTVGSPILSYLDVSRDDDPTLDGRPVPLVTAPLLSTVLGKSGDDGGLGVSVELLWYQHVVLYSKIWSAPTWSLCTALRSTSAIREKRCHLWLNYCYRTYQQTSWGAAAQVVSMSLEGPNFRPRLASRPSSTYALLRTLNLPQTKIRPGEESDWTQRYPRYLGLLLLRALFQ